MNDLPGFSRGNTLFQIYSLLNSLEDSQDFAWVKMNISEIVRTDESEVVEDLRDMYKAMYWVLEHDLENPQPIAIGRNSLIVEPTNSSLQDAYLFLTFLNGENMERRLPVYLKNNRELLREFLRMKSVEVSKQKEIIQQYESDNDFQSWCDTYIEFHKFSSRCRDNSPDFSTAQRETLRTLFSQPIDQIFTDEKRAPLLFESVSLYALTDLRDTLLFDKDLTQKQSSFFEQIESFSYFQDEQDEFFLNELTPVQRQTFAKLKSSFRGGRIHSELLPEFFAFMDGIYHLDEEVSSQFLNVYYRPLIATYLDLAQDADKGKYSKNFSCLESYLENFLGFDIFQTPKYGVLELFMSQEFSSFHKDFRAICESKFWGGDETLDGTKLFVFLDGLKVLSQARQLSSHILNLYPLIFQLSHDCKNLYGKNLQELLGGKCDMLKDFINTIECAN